MNRHLLTFLLVLLIMNRSAAQLSGNYTINNLQSTAGTNFASFTDAINALNLQGVNTTTGATFMVSSGQTFNERPPTLTATGLAGAPIVFMKSGILANPIVTPPTAGTIALGTAIASFGGNGDGVIRIAGSDYVTFDGIDIGLNATFTTATQYYEYGYILFRVSTTNACHHVTIKNATINMQPLVQNAAGIYSSNIDAAGSTITAAASGRGEWNVFRKNTILNGYNGIVLRGSPDATAPYNQFEHFTTIDSNSVQNYGGASTECYGIYFINADTTLVTDNTMQSLSTAANTFGIRPAASTGSSIFVYRNTISMTSTSGGIYGIDNAAGSTPAGNTIDMSYNKILNSSASGTGSVYGIRGAGSAANLIISNNEISNITNTGTGTTYVIYSIPSGGQTISRVFKNHLHHVENTNPANTSTMYTHICNSALETHLYQNNIHDIVSLQTNAQIIGRSNTANFYYYNNTLSRFFTPNSNSSDGIRALEINGGTTNNKIFFNTIYLDSTSTATNYGNTCVHMGTGYNVELRNNILVNRSRPGSTSGLISAFKRSSTTLTSYNDLSDNNCFYADTLLPRRHVFVDGTNNLNITGFKALVGPDRDSLSFFDLPQFLNVSASPYNLSINPEGSPCLDGGSDVSAPFVINNDIAGNLRSSPPDIGAFEIGTILPVAYINLQAESAGQDAVLQWEVASENKIASFHVERSLDGKRFERIAYVKSTEYEMTANRFMKIDAAALHLNKDLYYRINQIDINGKSTYSRIVKISQSGTSKGSILVWPNPFTDVPNISIESDSETKVLLMITDIKGNKLIQRTLKVQKGATTLKLDDFSSFAPGVYFAKMTMDGKTMFAKLVKHN